MLTKIDGHDLVRYIKAGCIRLEHNREEVNRLNVFPVPDGDTGTNMYLTLLSAVKEGEKNWDQPLGKVAKSISMGSLMGARGNSGVILSQIFRGFARVLENKGTANAKDLAKAFRSGSDTAYNAVMKPVEGTILTVIRDIAAACEREAAENDDIIACMNKGVLAGRQTLAKTPQMLPILREAGVVDSGGQGLLYFLEGAMDGLASEKEVSMETYRTPSAPVSAAGAARMADAVVDLEFQYCTELLVKGNGLDCDDIKDHLAPLGDSMLVVGDDELVKIHIHSNHPGKVLETVLQFGQLSDIKIDNLLEEVHEHRQQWDHDPMTPSLAAPLAALPAIGLVAVVAGDGLSEILHNLGVDCVVEGGQTMNPSTEDLLKACADCPGQSVLLLPNNGNIILAAEQAAALCDKEVRVIPSRSVMQGVASLIAYQPDAELDDLVAEMHAAMQNVCYGEITTAVRETGINGYHVQEGDVIGLIAGELKSCGPDINAVFHELLAQMVTEDSELITLFYGQDLAASAAEALAAEAAEGYVDCEVECHYGGQPHYSFFIGVE